MSSGHADVVRRQRIRRSPARRRASAHRSFLSTCQRADRPNRPPFELNPNIIFSPAPQDGTSPRAKTRFWIDAGFDADHDGYLDQIGFSGAATLDSASWGTSLGLSGWTEGDFSYTPGSCTATLGNTTITMSYVTPGDGDHLLVQVGYSVEVTGGTAGASGSVTFAG
jgi:hypothetical protein